jgi:copper resistance protein B
MRTVRIYRLGLILILRVSSGFAQQQEPVTPIPVLTDEDRAAAFPDVGAHPHKNASNYYVLFDRLEWRSGNGERTATWDTVGWFGGDINRLWFRTEGEVDREAAQDAEAHLLYGRAFSRWWDFVAGVRQDFRPGPAQTWGAVGIQGLAPNFFEVEATAYVSPAGHTQGRLEAEYELLITNRLIVQPRTEINVSGKSDPRRGLGSGLTTAEAGLRLRYEFRREFAPYVGLEWNRMFGGTADFARGLGEPTRGTRFVAGVRAWF